MTENNTPMVMPVSPYGGYGNGGFGFGGDMGAWWLLILLFALGGWGGGFGFGGNGAIPMMNTTNDIQRGFDQSALVSGIAGVQNAVTSGFGDLQTALCGGFGTVNSNIANGFAQSEIAANARQMADMNQTFGLQTAITGVGTAAQAGLADLKYTIATEACNTRAASSADRQMIIDKLCQLELDGVKGQLAQAQRDNVALQNQLNMAAMRASDIETRAYIAQGFSNEVDALYNRLNNCPVPSTPVYGRTPIFTCGGNGCGCGMAA